MNITKQEIIKRMKIFKDTGEIDIDFAREKLIEYQYLKKENPALSMRVTNNLNEIITKNFTAVELFSKDVPGLLVYSELLINVIQNVRNALCNKYQNDIRININSAFRTKEYNDIYLPSIGYSTSANSKHKLGIALDITSPDIPLMDLYDSIILSSEILRKKRIIVYPLKNFIHVDLYGYQTYHKICVGTTLY